ncbi:unnamed protein product [Lepeophtheirus salmonis]|uniref:(salmon louse) hypothetical protein n=1 Tax=Lepeophtheirus salmonis TaxID=72036 RepID=A0A7R8D2T4_LEPSM|nr:unnamed protein product [Lepeophtheirus salmonis]CAF2979229.1 unnamed protein product [Lepeophtheirus salmonis]
MKPRERGIYLKGIFIVLAMFVTIEVVLLWFRNLQLSIPPAIHPMDMNGTLKNISQLRNILIKGSLKNELPIKGIAKYPEKTYHIPPTIHMVWVWSEIPQKYIQNLLSILRTKNVQHLQLNVPELIDDARKKRRKGVLSDILRCEIVFSFGGIYTDVDTIALKPFPIDIFSKSFVAYTDGIFKNLNCSFFGFPKGSQFLKFMLDFVRYKTYRKYAPDVLYTAGPPIFTTAFVSL